MMMRPRFFFLLPNSKKKKKIKNYVRRKPPSLQKKHWVSFLWLNILYSCEKDLDSLGRRERERECVCVCVSERGERERLNLKINFSFFFSSLSPLFFIFLKKRTLQTKKFVSPCSMETTNMNCSRKISVCLEKNLNQSLNSAIKNWMERNWFFFLKSTERYFPYRYAVWCILKQKGLIFKPSNYSVHIYIYYSRWILSQNLNARRRRDARRKRGFFFFLGCVCV